MMTWIATSTRASSAVQRLVIRDHYHHSNDSLIIIGKLHPVTFHILVWTYIPTIVPKLQVLDFNGRILKLRWQHLRRTRRAWTTSKSTALERCITTFGAIIDTIVEHWKMLIDSCSLVSYKISAANENAKILQSGWNRRVDTDNIIGTVVPIFLMSE